jgi:hypothetical protein
MQAALAPPIIGDEEQTGAQDESSAVNAGMISKRSPTSP